MDNEKDTQKIESAEDLEAEKEHLGEVKEEDIRTQIISEYGFDEENDKERIDRLLQKEMSYKKSLSTAIRQKRKYRDEFTKLNTKPPVDTGKTNFKPEDLDKHVTAALEKRDLESLEYTDDIKKAISRVMQVDEVGVKKAMSDPYVAAKIEVYNKKKQAEEAALNRNNKSGSKRDTANPLIPPDVDFSTKEGREEYDKWRKDTIKAGY